MKQSKRQFPSGGFPPSGQRILFPAIMALLLWSCQTGTPPRERTDLLVMTTDLVDDPAIFRLYDSLHSAKGVWPALEKANRAAGIRSVRIYRYGKRLVMTIETPVGADMAKMDSLYQSVDPSVKEWGVMMSGFQRALPGVDTAQKWVTMDVIHHYEDGVYKK